MGRKNTHTHLYCTSNLFKINIQESRRPGGFGPRLRQNKLEYCTVTVIIPSEGVGGAFRELDRRSEDSISADRSAVHRQYY